MEMETDHYHCVSCVNQRCAIKPQQGVSCNIMACPLACGAVFHSCKAAEHRLLCPLERVPCLNGGFGCPVTLLRHRMPAHLEVCPAGVVCCTMEWNRWPVSCLDYTSYESLSRGVEEAEQLDMTLALQDQRTLLESLKVVAMAPTAGRRTLVAAHSPLPASAPVASTSERSPYSVSVAQPPPPPSPGSAKERIANGINGLNEEHYGELYEATVETARSLAAALDVFSGAKSSDNSAECNRKLTSLEPKTPVGERCVCNGFSSAAPALHATCSLEGQEDRNVAVAQSPSGLTEALHVIPAVAQRASHVVLDDRGLVLLENWGVERKLHNLYLLRETDHFSVSNGRRGWLRSQSRPRLQPKMEDKMVDTSDLQQEDDPMGLGEIDLITAALLFCLEESRECRRISDTVYVDSYHVDFGTQTFNFPATILVTNTRVGDMASASACDHAAPQLSYPSPLKTLRLGLVLEALEVEAVPHNRYLPPNSHYQHMFPFVCGQSFRRDQFSSHFTNVHGDIHAGLNGWMEHRCPMAYYGCTFSQRRFFPSTQGAQVVHDRHLRSFGVQPCPGAELPSSSQSDLFSGLPVEIRWHIAGFLDSFSLCQLSMVSRTMRDLCASLLQARGIVELQWERRQCPAAHATVSWQIKNKVWRFSTAFSPVSLWGFNDLPSMSDHLRKCRFNTVEPKTEPVPLPAMCTARDAHSLRRVLRHINP